MSAASVPVARGRPDLELDQQRGPAGMVLFIITEAMLFLMLFFAYYYLRHYSPDWPSDPPKMRMALIMLAVLITSSVVLWSGEKRLEAGQTGVARAAVALTILLGIVFIGLQIYEYSDRLKTITPTTNAYGSIFYAITSLHGAHLVLGLLMLAYVLLLPAIGPTDRPPHRPLRSAGLYWHFVDAMWVVIVALLYIAPNVGR